MLFCWPSNKNLPGKKNTPMAQQNSFDIVSQVDSAEIINSPAWQEASDLGEWKPKIRPHTTNRQHSIFRKIA